jgi:hypothetical protein
MICADFRSLQPPQIWWFLPAKLFPCCSFASHPEMLWLQHVAGSRKWEVMSPTWVFYLKVVPNLRTQIRIFEMQVANLNQFLNLNRMLWHMKQVRKHTEGDHSNHVSLIFSELIFTVPPWICNCLSYIGRAYERHLTIAKSYWYWIKWDYSDMATSVNYVVVSYSSWSNCICRHTERVSWELDIS